MRSCLLVLAGFVVGAGLMLYWWPRQATGQPVPQAADLRVMISDQFLARTVQDHVSSIAFPKIEHVRITSLPPATLVVRLDLSAGPLTAPATLGLAPVAANGGVDVHIVSTQLAGVPVPPQLASLVADAINSNSQHLVTPHTRVTGVRVVSGALEVLADYA